MARHTMLHLSFALELHALVGFLHPVTLDDHPYFCLTFNLHPVVPSQSSHSNPKNRSIQSSPTKNPTILSGSWEMAKQKNNPEYKKQLRGLCSLFFLLLSLISLRALSFSLLEENRCYLIRAVPSRKVQKLTYSPAQRRDMCRKATRQGQGSLLSRACLCLAKGTERRVKAWGMFCGDVLS